MLWFEITARVPPAEVEAVAAAMRDVAPGGITVEEPVDILGPELGFRVRPNDFVFVRAYVPSGELGAVLTEDLRRAMQENHPSVELTAKALYEQDWAVSWREFFGPVEFGGRLRIVPTWVDEQPDPGRLVIRLDPGQAFGTGHHETTRLCLAALEYHLRPRAGVLDVGTGSGVLAIAAILLGASHVLGIDVDPVAIRVAEENCTANSVLDQVTLRTGTLENSSEGPYDLIVANISTQANLALLPDFPAKLVPGGLLILSGILASDAYRFREAAPALGLQFEELRVERDWCLMVYRRDT